MRLVVSILVLLAPSSAAGSSPQAAVSAAARDLAAQPERARPYLRYLSGYNLTEKWRREDKGYKVLNFQVHSLSRELFLTPPRKVAADLWCVDYRDYGWDAKTWERLLADEPYFSLTVKAEGEGRKQKVVKDWPGGVWNGPGPDNGKYFPKGAFKTEELATLPPGKGKAAGFWLDAKEAGYLVKETQSAVPVVRADWFVFYTAIQEGRKAGYYDFLNLGNKQADFERLIGRRKELDKEAKREVSGVLGRSGVTLQNRAIYRYGEGFWVTADFKTSTNLQNVLRLLDKGLEPPEGDASEQYGFLPNGLFAFWLQNAKGERQNVAPDFIASDGKASGTDRRVHVGLSCVRCHVEGIRPINDWARRQYQGDIRAGVKGDLDGKKDDEAYEKIKRFRQLYTTDLQERIDDDRRVYARALLKLTGLKPAEMAGLYAEFWDDYFEKDLLLEDAAREWGVKKEYMIEAFEAAAVQGKLDPIPAGLLKVKVGPDGKPALGPDKKPIRTPIEMRREHFDEVYSHGHQVIRGYRK